MALDTLVLCLMTRNFANLIVHIVYMVYIVHIVYMVYIVYIVHIVYIVYIEHIVCNDLLQ